MNRIVPIILGVLLALLLALAGWLFAGLPLFRKAVFPISGTHLTALPKVL
jgi:hypothetical protein